MYAWANGWTNSRDAGDLRRHGANYDVTVLQPRNNKVCSKRYKRRQPTGILILAASSLRAISVCENSHIWGTKIDASLALWRGQMTVMVYRITGQLSVCSRVCSDWQQRNKYQMSVLLSLCVGNQGIHRWPVISPHKWDSNVGNVSIWWRHNGIRKRQAHAG